MTSLVSVGLLFLIQRLPSDSSDLVRIAFAESLASLAETSRRFLETAYAMRRAAAASAAAASAIANAGIAAGGGSGAGQGSSLTSANQQVFVFIMPTPKSTLLLPLVELRVDGGTLMTIAL